MNPHGTNKATRLRRTRAGFTLVEALAALLFMAIVIPVAVKGLQIASLTGEVAARKASAARIADRLLSENALSPSTQTANQNGIVEEGSLTYKYQIRSQTWLVQTMRLVTAEVSFTAQGKPYEVHFSTLVDTSQQ